MKKVICTLAIAATTLMSTGVFAETLQDGVTLDSISVIQQARNETLHPMGAALKAAAAAAIGSDTYIVVMNFTDYPIQVGFPGYNPVLVGAHAATRYVRTNYVNLSHVDLYNAHGVKFKGIDAHFHDMISVYLKNGVFDPQITN